MKSMDLLVMSMSCLSLSCLSQAPLVEKKLSSGLSLVLTMFLLLHLSQLSEKI